MGHSHSMCNFPGFVLSFGVLATIAHESTNVVTLYLSPDGVSVIWLSGA